MGRGFWFQTPKSWITSQFGFLWFFKSDFFQSQPEKISKHLLQNYSSHLEKLIIQKSVTSLISEGKREGVCHEGPQKTRPSANQKKPVFSCNFFSLFCAQDVLVMNYSTVLLTQPQCRESQVHQGSLTGVTFWKPHEGKKFINLVQHLKNRHIQNQLDKFGIYFPSKFSVAPKSNYYPFP